MRRRRARLGSRDDRTVGAARQRASWSSASPSTASRPTAASAARRRGAGAAAPAAANVLTDAGVAVPLGERATLLQFSSAFCAPCRATRRVLGEVAGLVPGVTHVEVDAEQHLEVVRTLRVLRTPTTLILDAEGREVSRAAGCPSATRCSLRWRGRRHEPVRIADTMSIYRDGRFVGGSVGPYSGRHVLDHAHQAPRSGPLPRALGAVSNVLIGRDPT